MLRRLDLKKKQAAKNLMRRNCKMSLISMLFHISHFDRFRQ
jgi:hypothetical protein